WPDDWTDPATQREFWMGFYQEILATLGHADDRILLAEALFASFSDPAGYQLFEDVRPALEELAGRGVTLGVVSNFEPWLADILALQGIDHLFATVAISGVLGVAKPDPGIFQAALAEAGADPAAAVPVGACAGRRTAGQRRGRSPRGRHPPRPDRPVHPLPGARRHPPGRGSDGL